jgi:hypothetical protein
MLNTGNLVPEYMEIRTIELRQEERTAPQDTAIETFEHAKAIFGIREKYPIRTSRTA